MKLKLKLALQNTFFLLWWVAVEYEKKEYCCNKSISKERNMLFVAPRERFLYQVTKKYGEYPISTEMEVLGIHHKHVSFCN
jgi:hypothetical protein